MPGRELWHLNIWTATNTAGLNGNTILGAGDVINSVLKSLSSFAIKRGYKITFPLFNLRRVKVFDCEYKAILVQETQISMAIIAFTIEVILVFALIALRGHSFYKLFAMALCLQRGSPLQPKCSRQSPGAPE